MNSKPPMLVRASDKVPILFILSLLLFLIFARTGENLHGQLTKVGEFFWEDYFMLRSDAPPPTCNPAFDIEQRLNELEAAASTSADDFDLFEDDGFNREASRASLISQQQACATEHAIAKERQEKVTTGVKVFRNIEHQFAQASIFATAQQQLFLVLLLFASAFVATQQRHHIAFRPMHYSLDFKISTTTQFVANASLAVSAWAYRETTFSSGVEVTHPQIINGLFFGSAVLAATSFYQLFNMPKGEEGGSIPRALLSIPLYTFIMLLFAGIIILGSNHLPGLAIYFSSFFESAGTYLDVALYLWCGMLLKQTQLGERVFSLLTPWKLPPELLAFAAIVIMAVPTAYTGASSIIILAMGAVVYRELRKVGTRRQLALAATAMSGSSGIVLQPCLIVVVISILNKEVTTDELFHWGVRVFFLTALVFFVYAMIVKKSPLKIAPVSEALGPMLQHFKPLIPYIVTFGVMVVLYALLLDAYLDQFSAPIMLPILIISLILFERWISKEKPLYEDEERMDTVGGALTRSMKDSSIHIGGLLMMMSTFMVMMGLGGKTVSPTFLADMGSTLAVMGALVVMFVVIGMFMESMAAVGLVSLTIAPVAYSQGIDPIHFWMTCLVALELGYLSPPVALSHIFSRQVVGEEEALAASAEGDNFYYRHERLLLPLMVMGTTLLLVAFGPFFFGLYS